MDRKIGGEYNLTNMLVELFTTLASCHTHLNKWLEYEKGTIFWKGGDHFLEPFCDNIPNLMMATRDLTRLLASRDKSNFSPSNGFTSVLGKKALSSTNGRPLANELAGLLADGCNQCSTAIYKQHEQLLGLEHHWDDYGTEDCSAKAFVIQSLSRSIKLRIQEKSIEPVAFRGELASHSLALPLGLQSEQEQLPSDASVRSSEVFDLSCPNCNQNLRAPRGKYLKLTCPRCRHTFEMKT